MLRLLTATISLLLVASAKYMPQGFKTSIKKSMIDDAKDAYWDKIIQSLNKIEMPDFQDKHGNYLKGNSIHFKEDKKYVTFKLDKKHNELVFENKKLTAVFKSKAFRYHAAPLITATGHAEVDLNEIDVRVGTVFETQTTHDKHIVPAVKPRDVKCHINRGKMHIHLHGNFISDCAGFFSFFFKGTVCKSIEEAVYGILHDTIPKLTNKLIAKLDGQTKIPGIENFALDWQTPNVTHVDDHWVGIGFHSLFFNTEKGPIEPIPCTEVTHVTRHDDDKPERFQNFITAYAVNNFFGGLTDVGATIHGWIRAKTTKNALTCDTLNILLPGISKKYGKDTPVDVFFRTYSIADFTVEQDNEVMSSVSTLDLQFWVPNADGELEYAAGLGIEGSHFAFKALTDAMKLTLQIETLQVDKVNILECTFGRLNGAIIKTKINNGFHIAKPIVNKLLATYPIQFPEQIFGLFELQSLNLAYYDGYVYVGITPHFIGPQSLEFDADEFEYYASEDQLDYETVPIVQF